MGCRNIWLIPLKILCVEDDDDIRSIVGLALGLDEGFELRLAGSGQEANAIVQDDRWTPDIALIDILMPEMTGTDVMAFLHGLEATSRMPVVLMTASQWAKQPSRLLGRRGGRGHRQTLRSGDPRQKDTGILGSEQARQAKLNGQAVKPLVVIYMASARCGSFQPGLTKWQVYPFGIRSR